MRALAFCEYFADVTIYCIDDGHNLQFMCSPVKQRQLTWRELRDKWIAKYGPL